ncbi:glycosyltransferase involved in cell wall biosynthesis [Flavobacteriaceae bacterium MAR_2010_72]|nr:glycosyltransferase involved in cell wall biosynthesis [Flavobacteriaceae bacterium MAR_2010_72]
MNVSVIVPCYNQGCYLDEALQSVLEQSYTHWECIIVNDGSTDDTEAKAKEWIKKDSRFTYYSKPNGGLPSARNFGIERARGVYILPLDADDHISSNYIGVCVNELESKSAKLVYGKVERFGIQTGEWKLQPYLYTDLMVSNMIHCTAMYRKADWVQVGGYDECMVKGLEDWEFWVHILNKEDKVRKLDSITFYYRIKAASMITSMGKEEDLNIKAYVFNKHAAKYFGVFQHLIHYHKSQNQKWTSLALVLRRALVLLAQNIGLKSEVK